MTKGTAEQIGMATVSDEYSIWVLDVTKWNTIYDALPCSARTRALKTDEETLTKNLPKHIKYVGMCPLCGIALLKDVSENNANINVTNYHLAKVNGEENDVIVFSHIWANGIYRNLRKCSVCGKYEYSWNTKYLMGKDKFICDNCFYLEEKKWGFCFHCGCVHPKTDMKIVEGNLYCPDCFKTQISKCPECGALYDNNSEKFINGEVIKLCPSCTMKKYVFCEQCGGAFLRSDADKSFEDYGDGIICHDCIKRIKSRVYDYILGYHEFPSAKYKIGRRRADGEKNRKDLRYYGVELETEGACWEDIDVGTWLNDGNLVHAESDGSLDDETGIEFITMPCTLKFHQKEFDWNSFCCELSDSGAYSHSSDSCGLHIHVNRNALNPSTITKMDYLINHMKMICSILARRNSFYSADYHTESKIDYKVGYWSSVDCPKFYERDGNSLPENWCHNNRYTAVNVTNSATVEVRVFRGSLNSETIVGTIEFVDAVIEFAEASKPVMFNPKKTDNAMLCHAFLEFLFSHSEEYNNCINALRRLAKCSRVNRFIRHGNMGVKTSCANDIVNHIKGIPFRDSMVHIGEHEDD